MGDPFASSSDLGTGPESSNDPTTLSTGTASGPNTTSSASNNTAAGPNVPRDSSPTLTAIEPLAPPSPSQAVNRDPFAPTAATTTATPQSPSHNRQNGTPNRVPAPPPHRGQKRKSIGEWDFVKTIGAGSMGQVKLARHRYTSELCAIKVIPRAKVDHRRHGEGKKPPKESDESKDIRTIREASIGRLLNHPNICKLYEVHAMTNHFYMLFEYVSGGQMLDYIISHGSLKEKQARKFARSIGSALDYCHRNSIVHRDLKIENILISKSGEIKIIDFGLSNMFARRTQLKTFCGSLYFAAPELLNAKPYTGPEVDVWSFGVVLYVLVCGKVPFDDQSMPALHAKIKRGRVEYPNWLSSDCVDLLSRMLVVNSAERAPLSEVLYHPWMTKGYDGPPESFVSPRKPLQLPLDPQVTKELGGFDFGTQEDVERSLTEILESPEYIAACTNWYKNHQETMAKSKHSFGWDFTRRKEPFPASESSESVPDPTNAYHPLISMYYLASEKLERQRQADAENARMLDKSAQQVLNAPTTPVSGSGTGAVSAGGGGAYSAPKPNIPSISRPDPAHTPSRDPFLGPTSPIGSIRRTRSKHRSSQVPAESAPVAISGQRSSSPAAPYTPPPPTRQNYQGYHQSHRSEPPVVGTSASSTTRSPNIATQLLRRFSSKKKPRDHQRGVSLDQSTLKEEVLQPPAEVLSSVEKPLNRSTSMNDGPRTRRKPVHGHSLSVSMAKPSAGQDLTPVPPIPPEYQNSTAPVTTKAEELAIARSPSQYSSTPRKFHPSARAKSLGHGHYRRDSGNYGSGAGAVPAAPSSPLRTQFVPPRNTSGQSNNNTNNNNTAIVDDEFFDEVALDTPTSDNSRSSLGEATSSSGMPSIEFPKQVFLKGFFSVQSTSTKSLAFIRSDIIRVLQHLGVEYREIRGGFLCIHRPSIIDAGHQQTPSPEDHQSLLNASNTPPASPVTNTSNTPGHWRKRSFGSGMFRRRSMVGGESTGNIVDSDMSADSMAGGVVGGSDMISGNGESASSAIVRTPLRFEIYIVKVPLLSLHGIQFKKLTGNSWQYKNLATKILSELRL